jgi:hypothetical protein
MGKKSSLSEWIETLPSDGRYTFTREEAEFASGGSSFIAVQTALRRLKKKGRIVSPWRGFYVFVPPEHRVVKAPPASWFIDDLMKHCGRNYYVGLLTAAALHGAGHQQPMVFQVFANRTTQNMQVGRTSIKFYFSRVLERMLTVQLTTETGFMTVASPETTVYDLVRFPEEAGYWSNVATVIAELADKLNPKLLLSIAKNRRLPDTQRLGFILSYIEQEQLAEPLAQWLRKRRTTIVKLRSDKPDDGYQVDARFRLIPNEEIEPDL